MSLLSSLRYTNHRLSSIRIRLGLRAIRFLKAADGGGQRRGGRGHGGRRLVAHEDEGNAHSAQCIDERHNLASRHSEGVPHAVGAQGVISVASNVIPRQVAQMVRAFAGTIGRQPSAFTFFLCGLDFALRPGQDIVIAGESDSPDAERLLSALNLTFTPNQVTQIKSGANASRLARFAGYTDGLQVVQGQTAAHLCVGSACQESVTGVQDMLGRILGKTR